MNNKKRTIIIGAIVIVLLIGILVVLKLTEPKDKEEDTSSTTSVAEVYALIEKNVDDFTAVDIIDGDSEYTIKKTTDGTYAIDSLDGHAQMNSYYESVVTAVSALNANTKVFDTVDDKAKYGLENPTRKLIAHFGDTAYTLLLGDKAADGSYYTMLEGDEALYTVSATIGDYAQRTPFFYLDMKLVESYNPEDPETTPKVEKLSIDRKDLEEPIVIVPVANSEDDNRMYMSGYRLSSPIETDLSYESDAAIVLGLFGRGANAILDFYQSADAAKYGFDDPTATIELVYNGGITKKITVGNKNEETGNYYALLNDNGLLYDISEENLVCMTVQTKDIISNLALLPNIIDIASVDVMLDGQSYTFEIKNETIPPAEEGGEETEDTTGATYNGKDLDVANFKKFYQLLLSASVEDIYTDEVSGEPTSSITYHYADTSKGSETLEMYDIGNRRMAMAVNGEMRFEGRFAYFDKLRTEVKSLIDGKDVDIDW